MATLPDLKVAHEVRVVALDLIREHHTHLVDANLIFLFTDQKRKKCDRVKIGSATKMNSLQRFLASGMDSVESGPDFIILIDSNFWSIAEPAARRALVDHELCHCALFVKDGSKSPAVWLRWTDTDPDLLLIDEYEDSRWGTRAHDIEEFSDVLARHGFWKPDEQEQRFFDVVLQLKLPDRNGHVKRMPAAAKEDTRD